MPVSRNLNDSIFILTLNGNLEQAETLKREYKLAERAERLHQKERIGQFMDELWSVFNQYEVLARFAKTGIEYVHSIATEIRSSHVYAKY